MVLNVAIVGYGRMGREIERLALEKGGMNVAAVIDPEVERGGIFFNRIDAESMKGVDVLIDFTRPDALIGNLRLAVKFKKSMVVGTTGWYEQMDEVRKIVDDSGIGFVYAHNFSVGVNLYFRVVEHAARLFDRFPSYDVFGYELHHNQKLDSPSGTALKVAELLVGNMSRKEKVVTDRLSRKIEPDEVHFASVRGGSIPGTHVVGFDSLADTIEIKHTARGRTGFADGALVAARWISDKNGFFSFEETIDDIIGGE